MTDDDKALVETEADRLHALIDATAQIWLDFQRKHSVPWEGAIDGAMVAACDRIEALTAEVARLREALKEAHWFYLGDDCSSDQCRFGIDECISEDFEWDNPAKGDHVLQISGGRPVPDMWVALHYFTNAEKDARDDDEPYAYTVHATEEAARAALGDET